MSILLDTHTCTWALGSSSKLSMTARNAIVEADTRAVSTVSIFEIAKKIRLGTWPEMDTALSTLVSTALACGMKWADVTPEVAHFAGTLDWPHPDPFDRLIAATALVNGWALISADPAFDTLNGLRRVW